MKDQKALIHVVKVGLIINTLLASLKLGAGVWGNATSLVTDGLNSVSDMLVSMVMLIIFLYATQKPDHDHHYGHEKYEGLAYFVLGLLFLGTSLLLVYGSIVSLFNQSYLLRETPHEYTIFVSILALLLKLFLYRFDSIQGKKLNSPLIKADARNHLVDVMATSIALLGIVIARMGLMIFDDVAALFIALFIFKVGYEVLKEATSFLTDQAPDEKEVKAIKDVIDQMKEVLSIDDLKVRKHMTQRYVDVEISVCATLSLKEAHEIAERVHLKVETKFPDVLHCMVHVNPNKQN